MLDFYGVAWEYEPHAFDLDTPAGMNRPRMFCPDLFLPAEGYYLELTTASTATVNLKNRKLRRMAELFPAVDVRLWTARDYHAVVARLDEAAAEGVRMPGPPPLQAPRRLEGTGSVA